MNSVALPGLQSLPRQSSESCLAGENLPGLQLPRLWVLGLQRSLSAFNQAARNPEATQLATLSRLLRRQRHTAYGQAHTFSKVNSLAEYQACVPMVRYETLRPWIAEIVAGTANVLTCDPVLAMQPSAGSPTKLLPVTAALQREMAAGMRPHLYSLLQHNPNLGRAPLCWQSHGAAVLGQSLGPMPLVGLAHRGPGIQVGGMAGAALQRQAVCLQPQPGASPNAVLLNLLRCGDLTALLMGNPAQLADLLAPLHVDLAALLQQLPPLRAAQIDANLQRLGHLCAKALWPNLRQVTLWRQGAMAALANELVPFFAGIWMGDSPVRSAEAHVTVPLHSGAQGAGEISGSGDPLALSSHFFEFIDAQQPRMQPLLAHQLRVGATYLPVVSTAGGLYRYRLDEAMLCTGTYLGAPRLTFVDRALCTSNLVGENLMAHQVQSAVQQACTQAQITHRFALCAPPAEDVTHKSESPAPAYTLYLDTHASEAQLAQVQAAIEPALCGAHAYWSCRHQGLLRPIEVKRVQDGWKRYRAALKNYHVQPGEVKACSLDPRRIWSMVLGD
jgi:hypothetical protein